MWFSRCHAKDLIKAWIKVISEIILKPLCHILGSKDRYIYQGYEESDLLTLSNLVKSITIPQHTRTRISSVVIAPKGHYSERVITPKGLRSEWSLLRRVVPPKGHCS